MTTTVVHIDPAQLDRQRHQRDTAIGRLQIAADIRLRATEQLASAMRAAHRAGATIEQLSIEAGLPMALTRKIATGGDFTQLILEVDQDA